MERRLVENICYAFLDLISYPELLALAPSTSQPTGLQYSSFVLSIVTGIIGLAANILVIFVTGFLMKKNKYRIWFLNLALADFIFLLILPLHAVSAIRGQWPYGSIVCKFYTFLSLVNMYAGIYILTALNIDRALSVAKPVWHRRFYSRRFCWCMCAAIWVTSATCSIPTIIYTDVQGPVDGEQCVLSFSAVNFSTILSAVYDLQKEASQMSFPQEPCTHISNTLEISTVMTLAAVWRDGLFSAVYSIVPLAVLGYGIPLSVILVSNIIIARHVKNSKMAATSRLYRLVIVSVMSFFGVRTPYVFANITTLVSTYSMKFTVMYKLYVIDSLLHSISATNSFLNPVVYVLVGNQVRSEIMKFLRKT